MAVKYECRISELAKELGVTSKDLLKKLGGKGKTASSSLTKAEVAKLKKAVPADNKKSLAKPKKSPAAKTALRPTAKAKSAVKAKAKSVVKAKAKSAVKAKANAPAKVKTEAPDAAIKKIEPKKADKVSGQAQETKAPDAGGKPARKRKRTKYETYVHILSQELGTTSKALIDEIKKRLGIEGKKANSGLSAEEVQKIKAAFLGPKPPPVQPDKTPDTKVLVPPVPPPLPPVKPVPPPAPKIKIDITTTVGSLAEKLNMSAVALIKKLIKQGIITTINQRLDTETASLIIQEEGFEPEIVDIYKDEVQKSDDRDMSRAVTRPPVITVMGHVDHGKTSLLDYIRKSHVAQKEFGNITQHIGAYQIKHGDYTMTFLDTPGHEAFTAMRMRGTQVTDVVVLVVAADDGIMPQTREAISHAKLGGVPIIVAVNKIDLPAANIENVKQQLANENLLPEDWGGKTIVVPISAKTGEGVKDLLDMVQLQTEMMDLKADRLCRARGVVLEASLDTRRGPVATVLITDGILKIGESFICGFAGGKVRAIHLESGGNVRDVFPGTPVEVMGFATLPEVGDEFSVISNAGLSRDILSSRKRVQDDMKFSAQALSGSIGGDDSKTVKVILKSDVQGSLEAIRDSLSKLDSSEVRLQIVHAACGGINQSDILLAQASGSIIIAFNVKGTDKVESEAQEKCVEIRSYTVIYKLLEDLKKALEGKLAPIYNEAPIGRAEVLKIYNISRIGTVAGCIVTKGKLKQKARARLVRDDKIIYTGSLLSLRRFKDEASEVMEGMECGITLDKYNDLKPGDVIEAYELEKIARVLGDAKE
ncbi:MAG: translation initiation factor IF-2 [Elusimicrobia bacterium CG03_land_8_20_14_0_80_50_18]|nr:MAG: translation initiation factor IF-2 [Elusimicrobia bacterium CG03_land_8_20_14_0_80_50_18]